VGPRREDHESQFEADIRGFYDAIDHASMLKFIEHRIGDTRIVRLIQKWLTAGVLENGTWSDTERGAPQGATASPLLANVYLHHVFDLWVKQWRKLYARGEVYVVRYADDLVLGFQYEDDARRFHHALAERLRQFGLELHPEKTRLLRFGTRAEEQRRQRGEKKPETFDFLGLTHICGKTRKGWFLLHRHTSKPRMRARLRSIRDTLRRRRHEPPEVQGKWLQSVVRGYFAYHAVPTHIERLRSFRTQVARHWVKALRRRSQHDHTTWETMKRRIEKWLPKPRMMHPLPHERFDVKHPR